MLPSSSDKRSSDQTATAGFSMDKGESGLAQITAGTIYFLILSALKKFDRRAALFCAWRLGLFLTSFQRLPLRYSQCSPIFLYSPVKVLISNTQPPDRPTMT